MGTQDVFAIFATHEPAERTAVALQLMDAPGLAAFFVDGEHQATVLQLFVDLDGGRRKEDGARAFNDVLVSDEPAGLRILAGEISGSGNIF